MSDHSIYLVPTEIDSPIPIFSWEITELVIAMMVLGIGLVLRQFLFGIISAIFILKLAKKIRAGRKRGQVQHLIWRLGLNLDTPLKKYGPRSLMLEYMR